MKPVFNKLLPVVALAGLGVLVACSEKSSNGIVSEESSEQERQVDKNLTAAEEWSSRDAEPEGQIQRASRVQQTVPVSQVEGDNPDVLTEEELRRTHVPFAQLLNGSWATDGKNCGDKENLIFDGWDEGTFTRGDRAGTYTFKNMKLSMKSPLGNSDGRVNVVGLGRIMIEWVDWKTVGYTKCD